MESNMPWWIYARKYLQLVDDHRKVGHRNDWVVISMEDWAEIRPLHRSNGLGKREITRRLGISRVTVDRALASDRPLKYSWPAVARWFTPV